MQASLLLRLASLALGTLAFVSAAEAAPITPSTELQAYSGNNLEHLLGPLNNGALPRPELARLQTEYQARLAGAPGAEKAVLSAAVKACVAFGRLMDEREKAVGATEGAAANNLNSLGSTKLHARKGDEFSLNQKRREIREGQSDSRFISTAAETAANEHWKQRGQAWRESIQQLLLQERQTEIAAEAAATAAAAKTKGEESDPVAGTWMLESGNSLVLLPDHTITGRHGTWTYAGSNDKGRNYQLHWTPPKNWTDYLVLSSDGNSLNGHTRGDKGMVLYRQ